MLRHQLKHKDCRAERNTNFKRQQKHQLKLLRYKRQHQAIQQLAHTNTTELTNTELNKLPIEAATNTMWHIDWTVKYQLQHRLKHKRLHLLKPVKKRNNDKRWNTNRSNRRSRYLYMQILRVELRHEELKLKCEEEETITKTQCNTMWHIDWTVKYQLQHRLKHKRLHLLKPVKKRNNDKRWNTNRSNRRSRYLYMQILRVELRHEELKLKCEEEETITKTNENMNAQMLNDQMKTYVRTRRSRQKWKLTLLIWERWVKEEKNSNSKNRISKEEEWIVTNERRYNKRNETKRSNSRS